MLAYIVAPFGGWSDSGRRYSPAAGPTTARVTVQHAVSQELWTAVDTYANTHLVRADPAIDAALAASARAGLPPHEVAPNQGCFLQLLARLCGARTVLELGTLGGVSTIWLAQALPAG